MGLIEIPGEAAENGTEVWVHSLAPWPLGQASLAPGQAQNAAGRRGCPKSPHSLHVRGTGHGPEFLCLSPRLHCISPSLDFAWAPVHSTPGPTFLLPHSSDPYLLKCENWKIWRKKKKSLPPTPRKKPRQGRTKTTTTTHHQVHWLSPTHFSRNKLKNVKIVCGRGDSSKRGCTPRHSLKAYC